MKEQLEKIIELLTDIKSLLELQPEIFEGAIGDTKKAIALLKSEQDPEAPDTLKCGFLTGNCSTWMKDFQEMHSVRFCNLCQTKQVEGVKLECGLQSGPSVS